MQQDMVLDSVVRVPWDSLSTAQSVPDAIPEHLAHV